MTTTPARAADADLATDAAAGDVGAYASLYHRHIEAAWRLALATASSSEAAARATTNAFVRVIRLSGRGRDDVADQFRLHLLAATYREAQSGSGRAAAGGAGGAGGAGSAGGAGLVNAFANLPSRWRAAVWLQEVEGLPATAAGPILGVSGAAAVQLKKRGLAGIEHRVLQAGGNLPLPELASALGAGVAPVPAEVRAKTEAKWKRAVGRDRRQAAVTGGWLTERAPGPLTAAAVGLCAIGIVGLAVVGPSGTINRLAPAAPVASGAPAATGGGVTGATGGGTASSGGTPIVGGTGNGSGAAAAGGSAAVHGPHLVAAAPAATVSAPTTLAAVDTTLPTVTLPSLTLPPVTLPPVTLPPVTLPPVTLPPPATTPPAATTPVVQVNLNTGILGVNLGIGPGSCTGVQLLTLKIGCTGGPPGLSLGGTLLGGK